jgi:hypothetical protein
VYKTLQKAVKPTYSGAIDHRLNMLDNKKMNLAFTSKKVHELHAEERKLLDQLLDLQIKVNMKKLIHGFWDQWASHGQLPSSREQSTAVALNRGIYLFGGFARNLMADLKFYDLSAKKWLLVEQKTQVKNQARPTARSGHTMCRFGNDKFAIFGGVGGIDSTMNARKTFNDVHIFDT